MRCMYLIWDKIFYCLFDNFNYNIHTEYYFYYAQKLRTRLKKFKIRRFGTLAATYSKVVK